MILCIVYSYPESLDGFAVGENKIFRGAEETPMSSKKTDRREFLKQGAALAGGAAVGAASQTASGQYRDSMGAV